VTVKIRFLRPIAGYIRERVWHDSQQLSEQPDGSLIFSATVAGIDEIGHWVLRWGSGAQVLAPQSLCDVIKNHADKMATYYRGLPFDGGGNIEEKER
jgi:predicted DNA-binding transcriptional regulator YafY